MSSLTPRERIRLERYFQMENGYACDFTNNSLRDFVLWETEIDVYGGDYPECSKANKLRTFWNRESDKTTGKLIDAIIERWKAFLEGTPDGPSEEDLSNYDICKGIAKRLLGIATVGDLGAIAPHADEPHFDLLCREIRETVDRGQPAVALDRLHTYSVKRLRSICRARGIEFDSEVKLHALFKRYTEFLKGKGLLRSAMGERVMNQIAAVLDSYNTARNNQTFAHDNELLDDRESALIINTTTSIFTFINDAEEELGPAG